TAVDGAPVSGSRACQWKMAAPASRHAAASAASSCGENGTWGLRARPVYSLARTSMMTGVRRLTRPRPSHLPPLGGPPGAQLGALASRELEVAAVDHEGLAGHVADGVGEQELDDGSDVEVGVAVAAHRVHRVVDHERLLAEALLGRAAVGGRGRADA